MCLIAFAIGTSADCPLLLASNRDEWWQRPTRPLSDWRTHAGTRVWAGQDAEAGGSWLGFGDHGRVAMLTNVRPSAPENAPRSRGELVLHWLNGPRDMPSWRDLLAAVNPGDYNGFNLVLGDAHTGEWVWLSNRAPNHAVPAPLSGLPAGWTGSRLAPGVYGLSNAHLDTPWPKTVALRNAVQAAAHQSQIGRGPEADWHTPLLHALLDLRTAPHGDDAWAQALSSPFVHLPAQGYGTRSSLVARCARRDEGLHLELREWTHAVDHPHRASAPATHWPLAASVQRCFSINRWGMPTSS